MEKQTRIILTILWISFVPKNFAACAGISSQIGLPSNLQEDEHTLSGVVSQIIVNLNEVDERVDQISKPITLRTNDDSVFLKLDDLKRRVGYFIQDDSAKESNGCDDIKIILSGNETKPGVAICKNGACEVSVSSHRDEEGNIVTDVHLKIIRKLEDDPQMNDIPVVDGIRGIEDTNGPSTGFHPVNPFRPLTFLRNNIPQIQTRYRDEEPWYQGRRTFQSPQGIWRYHRPAESAARFPDHGGWPPRKPIIDDKIDPPLSKSQGSNK